MIGRPTSGQTALTRLANLTIEVPIGRQSRDYYAQQVSAEIACIFISRGLSTRAVGRVCWSGMIVSDEHVELPPVPGDRIPPSPDPLPVVPAHHGLPDRRGQRGADGALPP